MAPQHECDAAEATQVSVASGVRPFLLPLILPGLLQGKAQTFVTPMLPIFIKVDLGGSHGMVGAVASAYAVAQFFGSPPVGVLMQHLHYATAACLALLLLVTTALLSFAANSVYVLLAIRLVGGLGATAFDISRKAYIAAEVPSGIRGRVVAFLASMQKWAVMISALLSGIVAQHLATRSIFLVQAMLSFTAFLCLSVHAFCSKQCAGRTSEPDSPTGSGTPASNGGPSRPSVTLSAVLRDHWRSLVGAGLYCAMLNGIRNTWMIALPLRGHAIGLSKIGIGMSVAGYRAIDASLTFCVAGHLMDKYGLKAAAVPSMLLMGTAFALLSAVQGPATLAVAATVFGVGNGICGGILNSFATGLAPPQARTQFLGLWKMVTALGGISLPPIFGAVSDATSLDMAGYCLSLAALVAVIWVLVVVREVSPRTKSARETQVAVSLAAQHPTP
mmetsp:Transcript_14805/g.33557  ORF Transcript_14805/g.33557 Transcript_14805/m.33557 type:complete len:446 (+) Transcript_14805:80-1417(+)